MARCQRRVPLIQASCIVYAFERTAEDLSRLEAFLGILFERLEESLIHCFWQRWIHFAGAPRRLLHMRQHQCKRIGRIEELSAGGHLIQHGANRINVGSGIEI